MPAIKLTCPACKKHADVQAESRLGRKRALVLTCGHIMVTEYVEESPRKAYEDIRSTDNKSLYPYQVDFALFAETGNIRVICADRFGLGKTIEALAVMKIHAEARPFIVVAKSMILTQWARQIWRWTGLTPIVITDSKDVLEGFEAYVVSYDRLRRFDFDLVERLGIKTIILDECQQIKNTASQRTGRVRKLVSKAPHLLGLSGAPIENNTIEYFPILNMIRPDMFPTEAGYIQRDVDYYWNGYSYKSGGLRDPEGFKKKTASFIIRRSPEDVMDDFPTVSRNYQYCDLGGQVEAAYVKEFQAFAEAMNSNEGSSFERYNTILVKMTKLRHITGLAKIDPCVEFCEEFLSSNGSRKLVIFLHHLDVAKLLVARLNEMLVKLGYDKCTELSAQLSMSERDGVVQDFIKNERSRFMIASTLAGGEGLDGLQEVCSESIILERQWNPKKEENAEARLARLGQKVAKTVATYFIAVGTIDEFFAELVEKKRSITGTALDGVASDWEESSVIKELAQILLAKGGAKWHL